MTNIPKIIWLYWEQGWDKAPETVSACKKSWQYYNPDWEVRCLDAKTIKKYFNIEQWLPGDPIKTTGDKLISWFRDSLEKILHKSVRVFVNKQKRMKLPHKSDIIRINLISRYGGVWADATLWCNKPLNQWISPHIKQGFFALSQPWEGMLCSNFFLISLPNSYIANSWKKSIYDYWESHNKPHTYMLCYELFNSLYDNDKEFAKLWDKVVKINDPVTTEDGPHYFAPYTDKQLSKFDKEYRDYIDNNNSPMFKLTNTAQKPLHKYQSIQYLFNTIDK